MTCQCSICQRGRETAAQLEQLLPDQRKFWEAVYSDLEHAEMDRDVNAAVIDGSWPSADEIIRRARKRSKRKWIKPKIKRQGNKDGPR